MTPMTQDERDVIRRFAAGEKVLRSRAAKIYRRHETSQARSPEVRFMAEATSLVPDRLLLAHFRRQLAAA
jgi:hypothetical protein